MKLFYVFAAVAVLAGTVTAMHYNDIWLNKGNKEDFLLKNKIAPRFDEKTGPAINWTWENWIFGPTCHDITKYNIVDLSDKTLASVKESLEAVFAEHVCFFSLLCLLCR